uniref:Uncharacterized protein n=1 Tax=Daphnia galeata TaxID=27404 RepID=A0A8J2WD77_9CRUS|nr:unnamed protein product [Daphnia galeata]
MDHSNTDMFQQFAAVTSVTVPAKTKLGEWTRELIFSPTDSPILHVFRAYFFISTWRASGGALLLLQNIDHTFAEPTSNGAESNTNLFTVLPKGKTESEAAPNCWSSVKQDPIRFSTRVGGPLLLEKRTNKKTFRFYDKLSLLIRFKTSAKSLIASDHNRKLASNKAGKPVISKRNHVNIYFNNPGTAMIMTSDE